MFECGGGSAARVTFSPWTTHEQLGFRAEVGSHFLWILSFGDAKESISPTAKTLMTAILQCHLVAVAEVTQWRRLSVSGTKAYVNRA
ncbi:hypothetical protein [Alishewanella sp. SMS8]|uniref:hypothetical protein n=1 Tax=Alishewanella sp. SMS8 TaxID=2994676 RepID=UPI0027414DA3|nr:hypothetical protein [Alishewanella sp. SMS8]MDP5458959.1 hypothetical protein [Alishewanella sp. SMS8]